MPRPRRDELIARYNFAIDEFQIEALDALDRGDSVLVAAPTGSGKTLVAEYAIEAARRQGQRAFYTAPIKALSQIKNSTILWRIMARVKSGCLPATTALTRMLRFWL